jgi:hypothetical protein
VRNSERREEAITMPSGSDDFPRFAAYKNEPPRLETKSGLARNPAASLILRFPAVRLSPPNFPLTVHEDECRASWSNWRGAETLMSKPHGIAIDT